VRYLFAEYALDTDRRELRRGAALVALEPQVFDLLNHLVRHRDRVISKDELLATVWQGRIVSDSTMFNRINAARGAIGDTGEQQRLIKTLPRKGLRFVGAVQEARAGAAVDEARLPLPARPSLAVLPFANMSGDPDQEYFADGISEDLITGLARIRWLFVIARNSSFVYKHRAVDVKQVARELGVRYVLEGSVRRAGDRLRISAQLVDAASGHHHWAERYDRDLGDIFAVQDEITRSVAGAIEPRLLAAEGIRALSRSADGLGAWELVARARTHFWRLTKPDYEAAALQLERAVAGYPEDAAARSLLGFCLVFAAHMGWIERDQGMLPGRQHAIRALALDDCDPWAHIALGYAAMMERRTEESIAAFARAVSLNPNSAAAHSHLSRGYAFAGRDREAIAHGDEAIRLSPLDPEMALFLGAIAVAHFTAGRYAEAARYTTDALRLRPGFQGAQRLRCASLALAGRTQEAHAFLAELRREQPQLSIAWVRANVPYQTPELTERFLAGMREAGLREE
jgi:TolB-like protein/Flp pilus assembly protein TadD